MEKKKLHIAMFPWLAFGHMIPYLELSKLFAQKGHRVSFISTPKNILRLPNTHNPLITFVPLPLPRVHNLPLNAEATSDLPYHLVPYLKEAFDALREHITNFLEASRPDWLLFDFAPYWLPPIARALHVPSAFFSIFIPQVLCMAKPASSSDEIDAPLDYTSPPGWVPFPTNVAFKLYEVLRISDSLLRGDGEAARVVSDIDRTERVLRGCDVIAVRSCYEFEPRWLDLLRRLQGKPVVPVGQLPMTKGRDEDDDDDDTWRWMREWLDRWEERSVVYVAFGSEVKPSQVELTEIALGLEMSGLPFFWVLRTRRGEADLDPIRLPDGFEERTRGRGVVVTSWAPQVKILSHDSVGGVLSHSGWSSVVEAVQFERPLVLLPFLADQGLNTRVLEGSNLGYPIPRDEADGSFTRSSVAESVRLVVVEEGGKVYREKVKEMMRVFGDRDAQERYVNDALAFLGNWKIDP